MRGILSWLSSKRCRADIKLLMLTSTSCAFHQVRATVSETGLWRYRAYFQIFFFEGSLWNLGIVSYIRWPFQNLSPITFMAINQNYVYRSQYSSINKRRECFQGLLARSLHIFWQTAWQWLLFLCSVTKRVASKNIR